MLVAGDIEGDVIPGLIEGGAGRLYYGREVVLFRHVAGLFGTRIGKRDIIREVTLCHGIINQCSLRDEPTPYWAVLDAACDLKSGFTKDQVIDRAVLVVGEGMRGACSVVWDVLRNHHRHARKRETGMAYMVDILSDGKLGIRARGRDETLQYFMAEVARKREAMRLLKGR